MTGKPPADQPTTAGFEFKRLLDLVTAQGTIIRAIPIGELEAINAIREMVIDAAEVQTTYTGS